MTDPRNTIENWRKLAKIRQFLIDKLDAKNAALEAKLTAAEARLSMYDARERS
ncbi:hypothetical protein [Pseudarthrobacter sp. S9]|uniref:hypothetical protein n=1 Tax=Pseudarthrobacter sp. S9 TaxID=3418421 RepID=UPI003D0351DD